VTDTDRLLRILARGGLPTDLADRARVVRGNVSWSRLFDRAEAHGVAPLVARSLATLGWPDVPPLARAAFEAARRINAARTALAARALRRVLDGLARAEVPVIPLKGVSLSESLYGDPALRVSADLDILVPRQCVDRARMILAELGYAAAAHEEPVEPAELGLLLESNIERAFTSNEAPGCPVELHWDIAWRWPHGADAIADLWRDARPRPFQDAPAHVLGPEWELLYLAVHAARHRWESLKWLVDIHEVCRRGELDWDKARAKAQRFGLRQVLEISLRASATLFETPLPASLPERALPGWLALFPSTPAPLDIWHGALYPARLFSRPSEKLRYLAGVLLVPTLAERRLIRLPARLRALYYPLRPLRLASRWGLDAARAARNHLTSSRSGADHRGPFRRRMRSAAGRVRSKQESA